MKIQMPASVKAVLDMLHTNGYEAYAVGGCVRDSILGRTPDDWDITTSALPEQVKAIFRKTVDTGIQHGTVTVLMGGGAHEVTTYRIDGEYRDGRHPEGVTFTRSLSEDLKRRDFTINAMAYNDREGLVDLHDGLADLTRKQIRCVGDPMERFSEDALRIMRAIRFSAQLNFRIEAETLNAVRTLAPTLAKISAERICTELLKLIRSGHPEYLELAYETGVTAVFLPEFDRTMVTPQNTPHHCYSVGRHILKSMQEVPADRVLRLTMLLHDIGKPDYRTTDETGRDHFKRHPEGSALLAKQILRRLKLDNDTIDRVTLLVLYHDWRVLPEKKAVRRAMARLGADIYPLLLKVQWADTLAQSEYRREEKLARIRENERLMQEILEEEDCISLKDLAVSGKDLIAAGIPAGPEIGRILQALLELVLEEPSRNRRDLLLSCAEELISARDGRDGQEKS